jgi:hypothetical protein
MEASILPFLLMLKIRDSQNQNPAQLTELSDIIFFLISYKYKSSVRMRGSFIKLNPEH